MSNADILTDTPEAETLQEQISSMMDGELDADGCLQVLQQVDEVSGNGAMYWERYHLMGDAIRNNLPDVLYTDLSSSISAAIAHEPLYSESIFSYQTTKSATVSDTASVVVQNRSPVLGYALAASISAVAIVGLFQLNQDELLPQPLSHSQSIASNQQQPVVLENIAWSHEAKQEPTLVQGRYPLSRIPDEKLDQYLINHNEHSIAMPTQGAMLPYARLVGYDRAP